LDGDPAYKRIEARLAERLAALQRCAGASCTRPPRLRLAMLGCRGQVRGASLERVQMRRRKGSTLRARVWTRDGRVVTLDRRLPRACRR
jgi:hypothetical protein